MKINKLLIANRGEIALRVMRSLRRLNIQSVAVYAENDKHSAHVAMADEAYSLGTGTLKDTYLNIEKLISTSIRSGAQAIHPGYGFLSENPLFAEACANAGLIFVGPDAQNIRLMGHKVAARETASSFGLPVTSGITGDPASLLSQASALSFPLLVKAAAGGGGKGMRIVRAAAELKNALETTAREALNYFGDETVYLETFIENPRHIEIQVLADHHGHVVHLFERECSIQRRYQKIIEESPSPSLSQEVRHEMGEAAVRLCKGIGYKNAGTIEFLVDSKLHYYFLEMNTRIQVEHPVTEIVTGIDLVEQQLLIAEGKALPFTQEEIKQTGHALECRIYAEDPGKNFLPSPGKIQYYDEPVMNGLRIDSSVTGPSDISASYDPMIAKLIASGSTRKETLALAVNALKNYAIHGIKTNLPFLKGILEHELFIKNAISTTFCDQTADLILQSLEYEREKTDKGAVFAAALLKNILCHDSNRPDSVWHHIGYWRQDMQFEIGCDSIQHQVVINEIKPSHLSYTLDGMPFEATIIREDKGRLTFVLNEQAAFAFVSNTENGDTTVQQCLHQFEVNRADQLGFLADHGQQQESANQGSLFAPMPGKVIKVHVKTGMKVERGTVLLVVEAMKMENNLVAPSPAIVDLVNVKEGDMVDTKTQLVHLKDIEE